MTSTTERPALTGLMKLLEAQQPAELQPCANALRTLASNETAYWKEVTPVYIFGEGAKTLEREGIIETGQATLQGPNQYSATAHFLTEKGKELHRRLEAEGAYELIYDSQRNTDEI